MCILAMIMMILVISYHQVAGFGNVKISSEAADKLRANNFDCTICNVLLTMVENEIHKENPRLDLFAEKICDAIPEHYSKYKLVCDLLVKGALDVIVNMLLKDYPATEICVAMKFASCNGCRLDNSTLTGKYSVEYAENAKRELGEVLAQLNALQLPALTKNKEMMNQLVKDMVTAKFEKLAQKENNKDAAQLQKEKKAQVVALLRAWIVSLVLLKKKMAPAKAGGLNVRGQPVVPTAGDDDHDLFPGSHMLLRNADWRGMDCDDKNPGIKPGIYDNNQNNRDMNCNGVYGTEPKTGESYESLYCNVTTRQVIMFGDSASSGFHVPPEWLDVDNMSDLGFVLEDEFDWPQKCWSTGWNSSLIGDDGSVYLRMRQRNLCMHRQYQNVGHNGGKIENFLSDQIPGLSMTPNSLPYLGFLAYIGNDVCKDELSEMTTTDQYYERLISGLNVLDKRSPPNSKLLLMGLVDGRILFNQMHNRTHPLGCTYEGLYNFLSCSGANPCPTWLTSNATRRNAASQRAQDLSMVAKKVSETVKLQNIELGYMDFPLDKMLDYCAKNNIPPYLLIEAFDGFHTSINFADKIEAGIIWDWLTINKPQWIGPINSYNTQIQQVFGNQGGF
ncbi:acyloxyacyl hydrolase-like protein [Naegleria gruberi]|uniref:Acyloxyacyl hydrolase-like protein n=1 Tax=Naegleria gruberi TaxID=5762 RepID=D2VJ96_NAEGR|nr:acyloxyacyl hydrolase-like protein [Naegleria gruberi]EFC43244.1 acyloxyacyl hydrolase-like protein [Naegleria gruberi]|eukprot:XP_002675988.1 acyloxyacyl hydrolase-like protein [Naegleria gruberi strain NEG-M]